MQPDDRDASYLWDILEAAKTAIEATRGKDFEAYEREPMLRLGTERCVEIVGLAADRISPQFREAHPEVPWQTLVSQGNVLAQEYWDIRHEAIWHLLREHLPALVAQLEPLLPPAPER